MWTFGLTMDTLVLPATIGVQPPPSAVLLEGIAAGVTFVVFVFLRFAHVHTSTQCTAGMWVLVLNAALITLFDMYNLSLFKAAVGLPSWTAILILAAAMIMPTTPRRTLIGSLIAAAMGPVSVWWRIWWAAPWSSPGVAFVIYLPNFIWAVIATLPSAMFQRMGRQIREAREMGSYELVEQLGAGGWGGVARAASFARARCRDEVVRHEALGDTESTAQAQLRRFEREAQATALLQSSIDPPVRFRAADDGSFYYVMELLYGRDLESLMKEFGPLPPERAMFLLPPSLSFAGRSPCAGNGPSRHQAREHLRMPDGSRVRLREGAGLWGTCRRGVRIRRTR